MFSWKEWPPAAWGTKLSTRLAAPIQLFKAPMVLINCKPAALLGSKTAHGAGVVVAGACEVLIGCP